MPSQRESQVKSQTLRVIAGVDERAHDTELPAEQYSLVEGVFPEFAGLQARIWGKRLLEKYSDAIYGIFQFWTPLGYGVGLYQFEDSVDAGPWLTPTSNFDLDLDDLPADGVNLTIDDLGNNWNTIDYSDVDLCTLSFLNGSVNHDVCSDPPKPIDIPDDTNGGPAGQGRNCQWQNSFEDREVQTYMVSKMNSVGTPYNTTERTENCGRIELGCNPFPPIPPTLGPQADFTNYSSAPLMGAIGSRQYRLAAAAFLPDWTIPGCDGSSNIQRVTAQLNNDIAVFNFASLQNENFIVQFVTLLALVPAGSIEITLAIPINPEENLTLNMLSYRGNGTPLVNPAGLGSTEQTDFVLATHFRLHYRERVCS